MAERETWKNADGSSRRASAASVGCIDNCSVAVSRCVTPSTNVNATTSLSGTTRNRAPRRARKRVGASPSLRVTVSMARSRSRIAVFCADAIQGGGQARAVDRLQQVVDRRELEGVNRILVVCRAEDHGRPGRSQRRCDIESAGAGHLDVEQDQIRRQLGNSLGRLEAILGFTDDLDVAVGAEQLPQPLSGGLLVVHQHGANHVVFTTRAVTSS